METDEHASAVSLKPPNPLPQSYCYRGSQPFNPNISNFSANSKLPGICETALARETGSLGGLIDEKNRVSKIS
jgi:hypothetical protein